MDNILASQAFIHEVNMLLDSHALLLIDLLAIFDMAFR